MNRRVAEWLFRFFGRWPIQALLWLEWGAGIFSIPPSVFHSIYLPLLALIIHLIQNPHLCRPVRPVF